MDGWMDGRTDGQTDQRIGFVWLDVSIFCLCGYKFYVSKLQVTQTWTSNVASDRKAVRTA